MAGGSTAEMRVERVEEPRVFGFTWRLHELPGDDPRRTYVGFTLEAAGAGTRLTVVETGFAQLPEDLYRKAFDGHTQGWATWPAACRSRGGRSPSTWPPGRGRPGDGRTGRAAPGAVPAAPVRVAQQFLAALARDWDGRLDAGQDHLDRSA